MPAGAFEIRSDNRRAAYQQAPLRLAIARQNLAVIIDHAQLDAERRAPLFELLLHPRVDIGFAQVRRQRAERAEREISVMPQAWITSTS